MDSRLRSAKRKWEANVEDVNVLVNYARLLLRSDPKVIEKVNDKYGEVAELADMIGYRSNYSLLPTSEAPYIVAALLLNKRGGYFLGQLEDQELAFYYIRNFINYFIRDSEILNGLILSLDNMDYQFMTPLALDLIGVLDGRPQNSLYMVLGSIITTPALNPMGQNVTRKQLKKISEALFKRYQVTEDAKEKANIIRILGSHIHYNWLEDKQRNKIANLINNAMIESKDLDIIMLALSEMVQFYLDNDYNEEIFIMNLYRFLRANQPTHYPEDEREDLDSVRHEVQEILEVLENEELTDEQKSNYLEEHSWY